MKSLYLFIFALLWSACSMAAAADRNINAHSPRPVSSEQVVELVSNLDFLFHPLFHDGQVNNTYSYYADKCPVSAPYWLLLNMQGPVHVNPDDFTVAEGEYWEGPVYRLVLRHQDEITQQTSVLEFHIHTGTGKTALRMYSPFVEKEIPIYQGYIIPKDYEPDYPAAGQPQAEEVALRIDQVISRTNFTVDLSHLPYPRQAFSRELRNAFGDTAPRFFRIFPDKIMSDQGIYSTNHHRVVYRRKVGGIWYLRLEFKHPALVSRFSRVVEHKDMVILDFAVNRFTGETNLRIGPPTRLRKNWRYYRGMPVKEN